ncbi:MAG: hypothetical protein IID08_06825 [Candidatus Hydrogenedentes bacterium]|nr:hypothetical protein [Candidatus Hydrogenedentota bacterium]
MNQDLAADYVLAHDLNARITTTWNGGLGWEPVGKPGNPFTGTLDGAGHAINGLVINRRSESYVGLFGAISGGARVSNVAIPQATTIRGGNYVGRIAGSADNAVIENVIVAGPTLGNNYIGGLFGIGGAGLVVRNSIVSEFGGSGNYYVGGIGGSLEGGTITNCRVLNRVKGYRYVGGIVGELKGGSQIVDCFSTALIDSNGYAGGIAGRSIADSAPSRILRCFGGGRVLGFEYIGGIVGVNGFQSEIEECFSFAAIGYSNTIPGIGGLVGSDAGGTVSNSFWDNEVSKRTTSAGGIGLSTAEMQTMAP